MGSLETSRAASDEGSRGRGGNDRRDSSVDLDITTGAYACACIHKLTRRLGPLQAEVLADTDPEPLHQWRVRLRRLRSLLKLFAPALLLPAGLSPQRLGWMARQSSLCRDLDVLTALLRSALAPALPEQEQRHLASALKHLAKERKQAFQALSASLGSRRHLHILARLDAWLGAPRITAMGALPLRPWAADWLAPTCAGLFLEEGWFGEDPGAEPLHALRKRLKAVRYGLETVEPLLGPELLAWLDSLKATQEHLGGIHDLQVLAQVLDGNGQRSWSRQPLPALRAAMAERRQHHWKQWLALRDAHTPEVRRRALASALARIGEH